MDVKLIIEFSKGGPEREILSQASQVVVRESLGQAITFTISYSEDICEGDFNKLKDELFDPLREINIAIEYEGIKIYLVKGLVQGQQITLKHGGQGSQVVVNGSDNSIRMDWMTETKNWKKKLDKFDILSLISGVNKHKQDKEPKKQKEKPIPRDYPFVQYNILGSTFMAEDIKDVSNQGQNNGAEQNDQDLSYEQEQTQRGTDLQFIKQLANEKGMYFWVTYGNETGEEIANFDKLPLDKEGEYDLIINDPNNNIDEFSLSWDADRPTSVRSNQIDKKNKNKKPENTEIAPQIKQGNVTLADLTGNLISSLLPAQADDEGTLKERNEAALNESEWFIKASCSTTFERLNRFCDRKDEDERDKLKIIHAHTLVNVHGAGSRHSGKYVVSGVTHTINAESYKMDIELMRNSWWDWSKVMETVLSPFSNVIETAMRFD